MSLTPTNVPSIYRRARKLVASTGIPSVARRTIRLFRRNRAPEDVFSEIYRSKKWGHGPSVSGHGSTLETTSRWRAEVPGLLSRLSISSMLDAPCGDFYWMREVSGLELDYVGADIVPDLIEENRRLYESSRRRFMVLDIIKDPLPKVDLVHCRDCLVHLPLGSVKEALDNIKRSGSTYLLTTTFPNTGRGNLEISTGEWRPLDLCRSPFDFPPPLWSLAEAPGLPRDNITRFKHLALWRTSDIPRF